MQPTPSDTSTLQQAAEEFVEIADACFGLCLDCTFGFQKNRDSLAKSQESILATPACAQDNIKTVEDLDKVDFFIGHGPPIDPKNIMYHRCTQGEYKDRNTVGGKNDRAIGRYCVVLLYEYWESEYRQRFADALGISRDKLTHDLFGDLRNLRHAIIHNRGRATKDCATLRILARVSEGTEISLKTEEMYHLTREIKAFVDGVVRLQTGRDPAYRTIWHVQ
jgi:hypothetical protein